MTRRTFLAVGALLVCASTGCRTQLPKYGTYSEVRAHAERIDIELDRLHTDVKDIVFGIEPVQAHSTWNVYDD
jgi:hypothetical protein